ncbi:citrate lyase acyl carrier protein [Vibrio salinus]|uniref:citrate lyase acyl carrier protein n=1 Tax=Vibrio salinus TaxID=2899784 RepID=UPI001E36E114|nr:citrate lyase acyl carrier protein [Vibrio salinus]MCE0492803.1 citrate lyase acyl carrier protein [Vibrio salinus]
MNITNPAFAGTLESSDIQVRISPIPEDTVEIVLNSSVQKQFGEAIESLIRKVCEEMNVLSVRIEAEDRGALDCVIRARVQAALMRASNQADINWESVK